MPPVWCSIVSSLHRACAFLLPATRRRPNTGLRKCAWHCSEFLVPGFLDRVRLWEDALQQNGAPAGIGVDVELLANRFALTAGAIHRACADAMRGTAIRGTAVAALTTQDFEAAARAQSSHGLRCFAQKTDSTASWDALIVPPHIHRQLRDICTAERHRHTVYSKWGFDQRLSSGKGLNVLFAGSSGPAKPWLPESCPRTGPRPLPHRSFGRGQQIHR